jgi:hypothetical protein
MRTTSECAGLVAIFGPPLSKVAVDERGFAFAELANPLNSDQPFALFVEPVWADQHGRRDARGPGVLRVHVPCLTPLRGQHLERVLLVINGLVLLGSTGLDRDGDPFFQVHHACVEGPDPTPAVFDRLLKATITEVHNITRFLLRARMLAAGVSRDRVDATRKDLEHVASTTAPAAATGAITDAETAEFRARLDQGRVTPRDLLPKQRKHTKEDHD